MLMSLTLIVLISAGEGSQELALHDAVQTALGDNVSVNVRVTAPLPDAPNAQELVVTSGVDAIAIVDWLDVARRHAEVRLYRRGEHSWLQRTVEFGSEDSALEKGRTLGFAIAAMLPDAAQAAPKPGSESQPASDASRPAPSENVSSAASAAPAPIATTTPAPSPPPPAASEHPETATPGVTAEKHASGSRGTGSIDAALSGALVPGGTGGGFGGSLGGQLDVGAGGLSPRLDLAARAGAVAAIEGRSLTLDVAPGLAWAPLGRSSASALAWELRLAALVRYVEVSHEGALSETRSRWLPGARLSVAGLWWFTESWALVLSVGADATFGKTEIFWKEAEVASIPPLSLLLGLGVRAQL
jgi:hypothetical protein